MQVPNPIQEYEAKTAALERMVDRQALEIERLERLLSDRNRILGFRRGVGI
jgi:hypothetical protein